MCPKFLMKCIKHCTADDWCPTSCLGTIENNVSYNNFSLGGDFALSSLHLQLFVPFCALCTSDLTFFFFFVCLFHFVFWLFIHLTNNTTTYSNIVAANFQQSHGLILETKQHSLDTHCIFWQDIFNLLLQVDEWQMLHVAVMQLMYHQCFVCFDHPSDLSVNRVLWLWLSVTPPSTNIWTLRSLSGDCEVAVK